MGVIHRDISPDNLILRRSDHLPVLIDFGGVKQVAATVASQFYQPVAGTSSPATFRQVGYAPHEQIRWVVDPQRLVCSSSNGTGVAHRQRPQD